MGRWTEFLERKRREYGSSFDPSDLDPRFIQFYESGKRIKVLTYGVPKTGTVGITTGWKPMFLLIQTSRSLGSHWLLGKEATILGVKHGHSYKKGLFGKSKTS